ncbi:MAG: hypothetical protein EOO35_00590 [Cyanobacteriota bacterium]|nr:MAG: hypothetical protein EOO35_00590 [Cyanobacteriota bacterium]
MAALPHFPQAIVLHFAYILLCKMFSKMLTPMGAFCVAFLFKSKMKNTESKKNEIVLKWKVL